MENVFHLLTAEVQFFLSVVLSLLVFFSTVFFVWGKVDPKKDLKELKARTKSWWYIFGIMTVVLFLNKLFACIGLAVLAYFALKELLDALDLRESDQRLKLWAFLSIPPQFYFAYTNNYGLFISFIPIYMFLFLPFRAVLVGDTINVTRSFAIIQWSMMLTVFSISHLAMLLTQEPIVGFTAGNGALLLYLIFLTQFNDVLQFIWGKSLGKRKILPKVSPNKTWEGFLGGVLTTTVLSYFLKDLTPFTELQALGMGFLIGLTGFCGDVVVSSIKRDYGVKDMGNTIPGHGGIMDRIDSLSYTGLMFLHVSYILAWQ